MKPMFRYCNGGLSWRRDSVLSRFIGKFSRHCEGIDRFLDHIAFYS